MKTDATSFLKNSEEKEGSKNTGKKEEITSRTRQENEVKLEEEVLLFENSKLKKVYEWLTTEEAARYLKVSVKYLLNLTSNGRIPYFKFGRRNRFLLSDLNELLLAQPKGGTYGS